MDFGGDSLNDEARHRERKEEHERRKDKRIMTYEGSNKKPHASCNYILYD
jgi:hypothetical protein